MTDIPNIAPIRASAGKTDVLLDGVHYATARKMTVSGVGVELVFDLSDLLLLSDVRRRRRWKLVKGRRKVWFEFIEHGFDVVSAVAAQSIHSVQCPSPRGNGALVGIGVFVTGSTRADNVSVIFRAVVTR